MNLKNFDGWPLPVSSNGTNFAALRSYMKKNIANVVIKIYGQATWDTVLTDSSNYYLVLDVVSWHARPGGHSDTTVASHWGYVQMWADGNASEGGKGFYPRKRWLDP